MRNAYKQYIDIESDEKKQAYYLACVQLMDDKISQSLPIETMTQAEHLEAYCQAHTLVHSEIFVCA